MGIDLLNLDDIVFTHGHLDHTWGFVSLIQLFTETIFEKKKYKMPTIVAHLYAFLSRYDAELPEAGSLVSAERLSSLFHLQLSEKEQWITPQMLFLGQVPGEKGQLHRPENKVQTVHEMRGP